MSGLDNTSYTTRVFAGTGDVLTNQDSVVIYTNSGAKAVAMLGGGLVQPGRQYTLSNANTGTVTVTPQSGLINGAATLVIAAGTTAAPVAVTIASDGTNWYTISS